MYTEKKQSIFSSRIIKYRSSSISIFLTENDVQKLFFLNLLLVEYVYIQRICI